MKLHSFFIVSLTVALPGVIARAQEPRQMVPASVGIVLDTSGSMAHQLAKARQIVAEFMKSATPLDEFTVIQASDRPTALSGFVNASSALQALAFLQSKGRSALLDGIYLGMQLMKMARNERKVLLVISDGADNASRYTETEIMSALSETGVRVYTVGWNEPAEAPELLRRIAERGRGRYFGVADVSRLPQTAMDLSVATRAQP